ncbi:STAS domain-containing protein [Spiractinospora alimapuensis]|uniref:STAS domain-containing protein n=1 Tax=Spiractinospora alimapuensis TaxID=2820884 RepID=UPI001F3CE458|nr:STAS domain-containing protein [Spiractinospora alimapuensis]QVQ54428.1 STAS domain-containing protein [Spiractinospora alimapuensis]
MPELRTISHTDTETEHTVVSVAGELDIATAALFRTEVEEAIATAPAGDRVILDCGELEFIDSSGLQALIKCYKACVGVNKALVLAAPTERVVRILRVAALDRRIPIYPTVAVALAASLTTPPRQGQSGK